jgi:hypothetical protein
MTDIQQNMIFAFKIMSKCWLITTESWLFYQPKLKNQTSFSLDSGKEKEAKRNPNGQLLSKASKTHHTI